MSVSYQAVIWNRQKRIYDAVLAGSVVAYLALFAGLGALIHPNATAETLLIRGFGTAAFLLLHVILAIGPLARLDRRFLPLLYNRRHLGVTMFLLAAVHGVFSMVQFHALGDVNPLESLFASNRDYGSLADFPFQPLGFFALLVLFLMAATSHDFWLHNLGPRMWKRLHMLVYVAYALLVGHVTLGALQSERSPVLAAVMGAGLVTVLALHLLAAQRERRLDRARFETQREGYVEACGVHEIREGCAAVITLGGERVAVFRYSGRISAVSNVCRHQNGPLGEGRIIDGCITCPWHGYQYRPEDGCSPPPFDDKVETYRTRVLDGRVFVNPLPLAPGTRVEPALVNGSTGELARDEFYVGYVPRMPEMLGRWLRKLVIAMVAGLCAVALALVVAQQEFPLSRFEFGEYRAHEGTIEVRPYPALLSDRMRYWLVAPGKHGAAGLVRQGDRVRLEGSLISRGEDSMLEIRPESLRTVPGTGQAVPSVPGGMITVRGEIVDSKCYLGVMNPGQGKVHRECAVRCISGGVPPMLVYRDEAGLARTAMLVTSDERPLNREVLEVVAKPVIVSGRLLQRGDANLIAVAEIRR